MSPRQRERHTRLTARFAASDTTPGTITGTAVPIGKPITQGGYYTHVIEPGAFAKQIADPARLKVLWSHDPTEPIGRVLALAETASAMTYEALIVDDPNVPTAQKVLGLIRAGIVDEVSVGFDWVKWREEPNSKGDGVTIVHERATLREISPVVWGAAGRGAVIKTAADDTGPTMSEQIESWRRRLHLVR
jgi:HK97 family phage prohead protease